MPGLDERAVSPIHSIRDLAQAAGNYPPAGGRVAYSGAGYGGTITVLGANVTGWQVGDRVCALLAGGGDQRTTIHYSDAFPRPPWVELG